MGQEIELTISLSPRDARRLWRCAALVSRPRSTLQTATLVSTYFDTPEADLRRDRLTLRLRRDGGRWIQTLRRGGTVRASLHQRDEWETAVIGRHLNLDALSDAPGGELLSKARIRAALTPQAAARFRRSRCEVELVPGCVVDLCLDRGEIIAGEQRQALCEVELELKNGQPAHLFTFALALLEELPFRLEARSKEERALGLLFNDESLPVRAHAVRLEPSMPPRDAMRATIWACLGQFSANEAGLLVGQDTEYLHQARVALRRLWAALSVFAREFPVAERYPQVLDELQWLTRNLGPARDWDVFVDETLHIASPNVSHKAALRALKARARRRCETARRLALDSVSSIRYTALMLKFAQALMDLSTDPAPADALFSARTLDSVASGLIEKRYQKVLERGTRSTQGDIEGLHQLRIDIKKLRYVVEFFRDLYPRKKVRPLVSSITRIQEDLGALNDAANATRMCALLRKEDDSADMIHALSEINQQLSAAADEKILRLPESWRDFVAIKRFWFTT